jgi:hypothetical protein
LGTGGFRNARVLLEGFARNLVAAHAFDSAISDRGQE